MRVVIQRVLRASVEVEGKIKSQIQKGVLVFVGIEESDGEEDSEWLAHKIVNMRIFSDENGVMNKSLIDVGGDLLLVSQFTLHAKTKKGNRPSYVRAANREISLRLYTHFISCLQRVLGKLIGTGEFGADMKVALINDGPITIAMDSKNKE